MIDIESPRMSETVHITDMTNAMKRGKKCRCFAFYGNLYEPEQGTYQYQDETEVTKKIKGMISSDEFPKEFDDAVSAIMAEIATIKDPCCLKTRTFEIRGVDAPRKKLYAGLEGVWRGYVDSNGVHLADLTDKLNEPREITHHSQSYNKAYDLAAKVWDKVQGAKTINEASQILRDAGCKLHFFCAMD